MFSMPVSFLGKIARGSIYVVGAMLAALVASPHLMSHFGEDGKEAVAVGLAGLIALRAYIDTSNGDKHPSEAAAQMATTVGETLAESAKQQVMDRLPGALVSGLSRVVPDATRPTEAPVVPSTGEESPTVVTSPLAASPEPEVAEEEQPLEPRV